MASARWERRNVRARAKGYRNYYDYRAHHYGQRAPSLPAARGPALRRLRGHAGGADLGNALRGRRVDMINVIQTSYDPPEFEVNATLTNGRLTVFTLRGEDQIDQFNAEMEDLGPDEPMMAGSPKAIAALRAGGIL